MKIADNTPIGPAYGPRRKGGVSGTQGGNFEQLLGGAESASSDASAVTDVAGIGSLDGMLALQGVTGEEMRKRETLRRGHSMLDALEQLRASLLAGRVPPEVIM